jgi:hypothetical protein
MTSSNDGRDTASVSVRRALRTMLGGSRGALSFVGRNAGPRLS